MGQRPGLDRFDKGQRGEAEQGETYTRIKNSQAYLAIALPKKHDREGHVFQVSGARLEFCASDQI